MQQLLFFVGKLFSYICPPILLDKLDAIKLHIFIGYKSRQLYAQRKDRERKYYCSQQRGDQKYSTLLYCSRITCKNHKEN